MRANRKRLAQFSWLLALALVAVTPALAEEATEITPPQVKSSSQIAPFYPATAISSGVSATVRLLAQVRADGKVGELSVIECDRPQLGFEESARNSVAHWRFVPARKDGRPTEYYTYIAINIQPPARGARDGAAVTRYVVSGAGPAARGSGLPGRSAGAQSPAGYSPAAFGDDTAHSVARSWEPAKLGQGTDRRHFSPSPRREVGLPNSGNHNGASAAGRRN